MTKKKVAPFRVLQLTTGGGMLSARIRIGNLQSAGFVIVVRDISGAGSNKVIKKGAITTVNPLIVDIADPAGLGCRRNCDLLWTIILLDEDTAGIRTEILQDGNVVANGTFTETDAIDSKDGAYRFRAKMEIK